MNQTCYRCMSQRVSDDLSDHDLSDHDLSGQDLSDHDLSNQDLSNQDLSALDLSALDLSADDTSSLQLIYQHEIRPQCKSTRAYHERYHHMDGL